MPHAKGDDGGVRNTVIAVGVFGGAVVVGALVAFKGSKGKGGKAVKTLSELQRIGLLRPEVKEKWLAVLREAKGIALPGRIVTGTTLRTAAAQKVQFEEGRSAIQTVGFHGVGAAIDFYYTVNPPALESWTKHVPLLRKVVKIAEKHGFTSLAFNADGTQRIIKTKKGSFWDAGHVEYRTPEVVKAIAALKTKIAKGVA